MFAGWKRKIEEKKAKDKAIAESRYWKEHPGVQTCLQAMRGSCTVAPMELHEAVIAAVNIAITENIWEKCATVPEDFLFETVFIIWSNEKLPVLRAPWALIAENIAEVTAVAGNTYLVSTSMDRIVWYDDHGERKIYSIV